MSKQRKPVSIGTILLCLWSTQPAYYQLAAADRDFRHRRNKRAHRMPLQAQRGRAQKTPS